MMVLGDHATIDIAVHYVTEFIVKVAMMYLLPLISRREWLTVENTTNMSDDYK